MVFVRAGLGNNVDDAAGDSTELHFVVVRLHLEFLNFVDNGGDRVGREGHFRIVNAVQHEIVAPVGLTIYGGKNEANPWGGPRTTAHFSRTEKGDAKREGEKTTNTSPPPLRATFLLRLSNAPPIHLFRIDV